MTLQPLHELVTAAIEDWDSRIEESLFGTADPVAVAELIESFVTAAVGHPVGGLLYRKSVGAVAALTLADGSSIVVKIHRWNASTEWLRSVQAVQRHLARAGLPAPLPLTEPATLGHGIATIEEHRPGERADGRDRDVRRSIAEGLHSLIGHAPPAESVQVGGPPYLTGQGDDLWPQPHDIHFDFDATADGAEWIDDLARSARKRLDLDLATPPVIGHFDWRVENLAFAGSEIVAIYDWDSLAAASEPVVVGAAAASYCIAWHAHHIDDPVPTVDDMAMFVDDYESCRGTPFTAVERRHLDAANLASIAYGARCQHSDLVLQPQSAGPSDVAWFRLLRERGEHCFSSP